MFGVGSANKGKDIPLYEKDSDQKVKQISMNEREDTLKMLEETFK